MNIPFPLIVILWIIAGSLVISVVGFIVAGYVIIREGKSARRDYESRVSLAQARRSARGRN